MGEKNDTKYIGVHRRRDNGRYVFKVNFTYNKIRYNFGSYKDSKSAAKAHDLFVLKKNFERKTNFFQQKLC